MKKKLILALFFIVNLLFVEKVFSEESNTQETLHLSVLDKNLVESLTKKKPR